MYNFSMQFFQPPPISQYDLHFEIFGFDVRIHPFFWLVTVLFGLSSGSLLVLLLWVPIVFLSILIHELGHAFAMRSFDEDAHIVLYGFGGLAVPVKTWGWRTSNQQIVISLAGPFAGFLLAGLVVALVKILGGVASVNFIFWIIPMPVAGFLEGGELINRLISLLLWVNFFWGLINLLPVFPLDGGKVSQQVFMQVDPVDGLTKSLWVSAIVGGLVAIGGVFLLQSLYLGFLFGFLAFQSYQRLQGRSGVY